MNPVRCLALLLAASASACASSRGALVDERCHERMSPRSVLSEARGSVVLIRTERATGTGFVIRPREDLTLVVTNRHVIQGAAEDPTVVFDGGLEVRAEIARASIEDDLALLRLPAQLPASPAPVSRLEPTLGQDLLVLGFPGVRGSALTLTAEAGAVTSLDRRLGAARYLQTNANINPGNSGGPAFDACGAVIGVVVAKMNHVDLVNLLIPTDKLVTLVKQELAGPPEPEVAVAQVVEDFFDKLTHGQPIEAASRHLSDDYLRREMRPYLERRIVKMAEKVRRVRMMVPGASPEQLIEQLGEGDRLVFAIAEALSGDQIDETRSMQIAFGLFALERVGEVSAFELSTVRASAQTAEARLRVRLASGRRQALRVRLAERRGRWSIDELIYR